MPGKGLVLRNIDPQQWHKWQKQFREHIEEDQDNLVLGSNALSLLSSHKLAFAIADNLAHARDLASNLALVLTPVSDLADNISCDVAFALTLALVLARDRDLALVRDPNHNFVDDRNRDYKLVYTLCPDLKFDRARIQDRARARNRTGNIDLDFASTNNNELISYLALARDLVRNRNLDQEYQSIRVYLCSVVVLWDFIFELYDQIYRNGDRFQQTYQSCNEYDNVIQECLGRRDQVCKLYSFFALIDLRRQGKMPDWESIRIVRERSDD